MSTAKDLLQFIFGQAIIVVLIDQTEGTLQVLLSQQLVFLVSCSDELGVVNSSIAIVIGGFEHLAHIRLLYVEDLGDLLHA